MHNKANPAYAVNRAADLPVRGSRSVALSRPIGAKQMLKDILRIFFVAMGIFLIFLTLFGEGRLSSARLVQGLALAIGLIVTPFTAFAYVLVVECHDIVDWF
jgi:hypothetical protein